ncbi:hypothetical protein SUDANB121_05818 [Nocardiopsis dassonvillei]|uniref:competence protein CoiA family protein n=1 Tax=Nocardiopsis dassonvillei TaxID=2014 RepID=UPI003F57959F
MADELALVLWVAAGLEIDPNLDDFGLAPQDLRALLYTAPGKRRSYRKGDLLCTRCLETPRRQDAASMYVRQKRNREGFWEVAHHASKKDPCHAVESDEHKAWKDRIATDASKAGLFADYESSTKDRKGRTDVIVVGPDGRRISWEVQIARTSKGNITRRTNTAYRDGRTPSWLTTVLSAKSKTRELIHKVPWSMANQMLPEQILHGRAAWVSDGISTYRWKWCRNIPGPCPDPGRLTLDCGKEHGIWERSPTRLEEFVESSAGGLLVPLAIPSADMRSVSRIWATPDDHDEYAHAQRRRFTESDLPERLRIHTTPATRTDKGYQSHDSVLHQPEKTRPRPSGGSRTFRDGAAHTRERTPVIPVVTRDRPFTKPEPETTPTVSDEIASWIAEAMPGQEHLPCGHHLAIKGAPCGAIPTRAYIGGRRCWYHAPRAFTNQNKNP